MTRRLVLGTAGHIDHGKTELVRALTGTETDRLPEEQERGITIDLGFARLGGGAVDLAIVDVPGHEAFVRNMLAGATGMDVVLIVVAADEGVMPQTREHVAIAELLGVQAAVVALTKADLVEADWLELVREDVRTFLSATAYADAPLVTTSARTGEGIEALKRTLLADAEAAAPRPVDDLFRLPVDRVFSVKGTGTVVTGTVWSGTLTDGAEARLLPAGPTVRVRGLQRHNQPVPSIEAGQRAALALAGVDREAVRRGDTVVDEPGWASSSMLTVRATVIPGTTWRIQHRQRVRVHLGTAEVMARAVLLDGDALEPGQDGWAQLRLEAPLVARTGDRLVVRSYSPVTTIAGGIVAEPAPPKRRRLDPELGDVLDRRMTGPASDAVVARVRQAGDRGVPHDRLPLEVAVSAPVAYAAAEESDRIRNVGPLYVDAEILDGLSRFLVRTVKAYHEAEPLRPGMDREAVRGSAPGSPDPRVVDHALDALAEGGTLVGRGGGTVALATFRVRLSESQQKVRDRIVAAYRDAGLAAPSADESNTGDAALRDRLVDLLVADGTLVPVGPDMLVHRDAISDAVARVRRDLAGRRELAPGDFREVLGVSRKYLIPLLEHLDGRGVTIRTRDGREVPGRGENS